MSSSPSKTNCKQKWISLLLTKTKRITRTDSSKERSMSSTSNSMQIESHRIGTALQMKTIKESRSWEMRSLRNLCKLVKRRENTSICWIIHQQRERNSTKAFRMRTTTELAIQDLQVQATPKCKSSRVKSAKSKTCSSSSKTWIIVKWLKQQHLLSSRLTKSMAQSRACSRATRTKKKSENIFQAKKLPSRKHKRS